MTRDEVIRLAQQYCDYSSDSKGRESFEFDDYGLYHFANLIAAQYKQDAERYRWLREQNATLEDRTFYVGVDDRAEPEGIMWVGSDLDAAIDSARGDSKTDQLICPRCGVDRFKVPCPGPLHLCPIRGEAQ